MRTSTLKSQSQQQTQQVPAQTTSTRRRAALNQTSQQNQSPTKSGVSGEGQGNIPQQLNTQSVVSQQSNQQQKYSQNDVKSSPVITPQKTSLSLRSRGEQNKDKSGKSSNQSEIQIGGKEKVSMEILCEKSTLPDSDSQHLADQHSNSNSTNKPQQETHQMLSTEAVAAFTKQQQSHPFSFSPMLHKHSIGMDSYGQFGDAPSSVATLQPHPFNVLISDFQQRRGNATLKKSAHIDEFLTSFKSQIRDIDNQYYQQKQQIREQMQIAQSSEVTTHSQLQNPQQCLKLDQTLTKQQNESSSDHYQNLQNSMQSMGILGQLGLCPSQTPTNLMINQLHQQIPMINEPYESFEFVPNSLQFYYPKQVQRQLQKKKFQNSERIISGLKPPSNKASFQKNLEKMRSLTSCQMQFIRVVFQKIDRKSKPIKKQEKIVSENLKRKRIFLEEENFDILSVLHSSQSQEQKPEQQNGKILQSGSINAQNITIQGYMGASQVNSNPSLTNNQYQLNFNNHNENSLSNLSDLDPRINGQVDQTNSSLQQIPFGGHFAPVQQQISNNQQNSQVEGISGQTATQQSQNKTGSKQANNSTKTPVPAQKISAQPLESKKLALKKSQSVGIPGSSSTNNKKNQAAQQIDSHVDFEIQENIESERIHCNDIKIQIPIVTQTHNAHGTTIIIDSSVLQTPSKKGKGANQYSKAQTHSKKNASSRKNKGNQNLQGDYVQALDKENGSLNIKIILPEHAIHNSNGNSSMDKHTEADDQMHHDRVMIEHYDQDHDQGRILNHDEILQNSSALQGAHAQLEVHGHHIHHSHYLFGGPNDMEDDHTVPLNHHHLSKVHTNGFTQYLEIEHSHSEPTRFGVANHHHTTRNQMMGVPQGNHDVVMVQDYIDNYHPRNHYQNAPNTSIPQSTSTQMTGDHHNLHNHHDILMNNRMKANCQRNLDFFDFHNEMQAHQIPKTQTWVYNDQSDMFYNDYGHNRNVVIPDIQPSQTSSSGLLQKPSQSFFMGNASPEPPQAHHHHLLGSAVAAYDSSMFRDEYLPAEVISSEWNPLVIVEHQNSHHDGDHPQFNYEMRM